MNIFIDTSSLFKLYHYEKGSDELFDFFKQFPVNEIFISDLTRIEFASVIWKKCRKSDLDEIKANRIINLFNSDFDKFNKIYIDKTIIDLSSLLIGKYWKKGLRSLDSIQLASLISIRENISIFICSDKVLTQISELEQVRTVYF